MRNLTQAQHLVLDRQAFHNPNAKVVGWSDSDQGPIISSALSGRRAVVLPTGRFRRL